TPSDDQSYQYRHSPIGSFARDVAEELKKVNSQHLNNKDTYQADLQKNVLQSADEWLQGYIKGTNRPNVNFEKDTRDEKVQAAIGKEMKAYAEKHSKVLLDMFYGPLGKIQQRFHGNPAENRNDVKAITDRADKALYLIEQA